MITALLLAAAATPNAWVVTERADPITDLQYVTLTSEQGPNLIAIKCIKGKTEIAVSVINGVNMGGAPLLRSSIVRVDAKTPMNYTFGFIDYVAEGWGVGHFLGRDVLSANTKLAFRFPLSRSKGGETDVIFDATGVPVKAAVFKKKCAEIGVQIP